MFARLRSLFAYWAGVAMLVSWTLVSIVWPTKHALPGFAVIIVFLLFGPVCRVCHHPIVWDRNPKDPDHWSFYRPRFRFHARCGRCGRDLIDP